MPSATTQQSDYGLAIRAAVRALWKGLIDADQFYDWMSSAIWRGLTSAWYAGAEECNIQPTELSPAERSALQLVVAEEINHIGDFAASIIGFSKERGGKLANHLNRAKMWTVRWQDVHTRARIMACGDKKLKWVLGPTKEHCVSCDVKLNGKVKRASYWASVGVMPQAPVNPKLECKGFRCLCTMVETTDRATPGPLPSLP
jgi:hypothetical protein